MSIKDRVLRLVGIAIGLSFIGSIFVYPVIALVVGILGIMMLMAGIIYSLVFGEDSDGF